LSDLYPGTSHVALLGLDCTDDDGVWLFARDNGYTIVSKDADVGVAISALILAESGTQRLARIRASV